LQLLNQKLKKTNFRDEAINNLPEMTGWAANPSGW